MEMTLSANPLRDLVSVLPKSNWMSVSWFSIVALTRLEMENFNLPKKYDHEVVAEVIHQMKEVGFIEFKPDNKTLVRIKECFYE